MKEHNKLSEDEVVKLKNTLLQLNGALLRLGMDKEDTHIVLPKADWVYFNNVLSSGQSSMSKYYQIIETAYMESVDHASFYEKIKAVQLPENSIVLKLFNALKHIALS